MHLQFLHLAGVRISFGNNDEDDAQVASGALDLLVFAVGVLSVRYLPVVPAACRRHRFLDLVIREASTVFVFNGTVIEKSKFASNGGTTSTSASSVTT